MMLAAAVMLPRLLTGGAEPPADAVKLVPPQVQYRPNEASATRSPWIDANGWRMMRAPGRTFVYHVAGETAALAAAEAFSYSADVVIATDASGTKAFGRMLDFLRQIPQADLTPVADIGVVDDNSNATGELMNLLVRLNLLYKVEKTPDQSLKVNTRIAEETEKNPTLLARKARSQLGDDKRSLRLFGSDVVISRLLANSHQARIYLLNYASHAVIGLRIRVLGAYIRGDVRAFDVRDARLEDFNRDGDATEFTIPEIGAFAVIDVLR